MNNNTESRALLSTLTSNDARSRTLRAQVKVNQEANLDSQGKILFYSILFYSILFCLKSYITL